MPASPSSGAPASDASWRVHTEARGPWAVGLLYSQVSRVASFVACIPLFLFHSIPFLLWLRCAWAGFEAEGPRARARARGGCPPSPPPSGRRYNAVVQERVLSGPTNFAPLIDRAVEIVRSTGQVGGGGVGGDGMF